MTETSDNLAAKRKTWPRLLLVLAALIGLGLLGLYLFADEFEVRIDETTAQNALDQSLSKGPITRLGIEIEPKQFDISFSAEGRVELATILDLKGFSRAGSMDGNFQSGIRYSHGRFYLDDIAPVTSTITLDEDTDKEVSDIARVIRDRLKRERDAIVDTQASDAFDRLVDRNQTRIQEAATDAAQLFFTSIPIYDLRHAGAGGMVARLALKDVTFEDGEAIITMSPQTAVVKIISFLAMILLLVAYVFLTSPSLIYSLIRKRERSEDAL